MSKILLFLFFLLIIPKVSKGQKPPLIFHNLSIHDGLSENSINKIIEDKSGFMWFGTFDGLSKYDGNRFVVYNSLEEDSFSLSNRYIKNLLIDSKGNLWIGTTNGINLYDRALNRFYNYRNNTYSVFNKITQDIVAIAEDDKKQIWIGTASQSLICISSLNKEPKVYKSVVNEGDFVFHSMLIRSDSIIWIGTSDGLLEFNTHTHEFHDLRNRYGNGFEVRKMLMDTKGTVWLCTSMGLKKIDHNGNIKVYLQNESDTYSIKENGVVDIVSYGNDQFLVGTNSSSIEFFDSKSEKFYHYFGELTSNNINSIYKDSKGDLWVGTYLNGLDYSNSTTNLFFHEKNNQYSEKVVKNGIITRFLKDRKGNLWITTDGGGLYLKKNGTDKIINYLNGKNEIKTKVLISIYEDHDGEFWITTYGDGLYRYNPATNKVKHYKNDKSNPNSLFNNFTKDVISYNGQIWISGYDLGIGIFDKKSEKFKNIRYEPKANSLPTNWVQMFYIDKKGDLWLATFDGLSKYNAHDNSFNNFKFKPKGNKAPSDINSILEIFEDSKGNFWLGTMGNGLVLFNRDNGSYKVFTLEEGLSDNIVKSIIEDNHNQLWLGTNDGITKFNLKTFKAKPYTIKDGVPYCSYHYNARYKDEQGRIYLGANNGIVIVNPDMTDENKFIPPVVLTDFKIFNRSIVPGEKNSPITTTIDQCSEIVLSHDQNSISFEFAALNFNSPKNNQFAYFLEGFDKTWFYVGNQRTASYTNLNPGTYIFRVKGSNNDNIWNEQGLSLKVIIKPPFYQTWWFISMMVFLFLAFLYLIYLWRTRMIRKENLLLEDVVKKRTSQLKDANEQLETFVYKASHDIKGPLKSIIGLTTVGKTDILSGGDPIPYFDHILKSTSKLDTLVRDLLIITKEKQRELKEERINFQLLILDILTSFQNFPGYEKIKVGLDIDEKSEFYTDKQLLTSIIQNLIENGIKYSDHRKKQSYLNIKISVTDKGAHMVFKDNGIGIDEEFQNRIFEMFFKANEQSNGSGLGLYIVKSNIEKLKGFITIDSTIGEGTTFYIKL